jgi:processive 1,2-diacylglycerol beta-glucosyltransferase
MNNHFKQSDVLILSASYGGGHRSVSYAVADAIKYISPEIRVSVVDFYEILSPLFNRIIATTYVKIMKYIPSLYGLAYQLTYDLSADSIFNRILSKFGHEKFLEMLGVIKPKLILSSYPTYAGIISHLRKEKKADGISCIIITDFVAHSQWIYPDVDQYFVPSHEVKFHLIKKGIQSERIKVTGIPVHPRFLSEVDKGEVFRSDGLRKDVPILLVMAGIFGVTRGVREICEVIWDIPIDVQAVILCGEDKDLYSFLSKKHAGKMVPLSGFVNVWWNHNFRSYGHGPSYNRI